MAVRICPSCGGKVASTRSTCSHCGCEINSTKICPECEENIDANAQECPICGYEFDVKPMAEVPETEPTPKIEPVMTKPATSDPTPNPAVTSGNKVAVFKKKGTKEQFLRNLFYCIAKDSDSPVDILNAKFGEVQEGEAHGFAVYGKANGHYSATIGYNRVEKYTEQGSV